MADKVLSRARYGEAFWRAHHEVWRRSDLNQREYCEAHGIALKALGRPKIPLASEGASTHVHFPHTCLAGTSDAICSHFKFAGDEDEMSDEFLSRARYGEVFW